MKLTVLGSGSSIQFENRASASYLLETGGKKIVLDAGFLLLDRLERAGVRADEIDAVYISHKHPDHFMGLIHMLFALKNSYYNPKKNLLLFGFKGLESWFESFRAILGRWIEPDLKLEFSENEKDSLGSINWQIFPTVHSDESTGVMIKNNGKKLTYTGDTEYFRKLSEYSDGSDLLIAECGSGNNKIVSGHMCLNDIIKISNEASVAKILISHIYPETDITQKEWSQGTTTFMRSCDLHKISL